MLTSDQELLERWISNQDAEAFKDLSSRCAGMVFATCRRILGNDAEGRHTSEFVPNLESWYYVQKEGYTSVRSTPIIGEPAEEYPEETLLLYPSGGIEGILVDTNGQPLSNARIKIAHRAEGVKVDQVSYINVDSLNTTTDANVTFAIGDGFPAITGDVHIEVQFENGNWAKLTIIENVDVLPRHVTHIGTALILAQ